MRAFDPNCYLYISRAMDRFDLAAHGDGVDVTALKNSGVERALVIGVESDMLFAIAEQRALAEAAREAGIATRFRAAAASRDTIRFSSTSPRFGGEIGRFLSLNCLRRSGSEAALRSARSRHHLCGEKRISALVFTTAEVNSRVVDEGGLTRHEARPEGASRRSRRAQSVTSAGVRTMRCDFDRGE